MHVGFFVVQYENNYNLNNLNDIIKETIKSNNYSLRNFKNIILNSFNQWLSKQRQLQRQQLQIKKTDDFYVDVFGDRAICMIFIALLIGVVLIIDYSIWSNSKKKKTSKKNIS